MSVEECTYIEGEGPGDRDTYLLDLPFVAGICTRNIICQRLGAGEVVV